MKKTTWIIVADGAKAYILMNEGPGKGVTQIDAFQSEEALTKTSDIMSDKQGRSFSSVGQGRSAIEPHTDAQRYAKEKFAQAVAKAIVKQQDNFDRLVLVAPPKTLGDMRSVLHNGNGKVKEKIIGELPKDLTHLAAQDLPEHLKDIVLL